MNDDDYLSTLNRLLGDLDSFTKNLEILKAAHALSITEFEDISPATNLLRVSLLIEACIAHFECDHDDMKSALNRELRCLTSSKAKCCSSSKSSKSE